MCCYIKTTYKNCQDDNGPHQTAKYFGPCPEVVEKMRLPENIDRVLVNCKKRKFRLYHIKSNKTDVCPVCAGEDSGLNYGGPWEDEIESENELDPQKSTKTGKAVTGGTVAGGNVAGGNVAGGTVAGGTVP
ncbi:hypothetical protein QC760_005156 [Botrytis cinerea]